MSNIITKNIQVSGKHVILKAVFKLPTGWVGFVSDDYVKIPSDRCHVSPSFDDDEYADKNCWTKNSVLNYLEKKVVEPKHDNKFIEHAVSKKLINYFVIAEFKMNSYSVGWIGYIVINDEKKFVRINHDKCHVSPSFEDEDDVSEYNWTKKAVLKYLHKVANEM